MPIVHRVVRRRRAVLPVLIVAGLLAGACAAPASAATSPVTFTRDVAPVMFQHCSSCHRPGEAAPFSLLTYDDAKGRARLLADVTAQRLMPPWQPSPEVGDFEGSRRLADHDVAIFQQWLDDGMLEGDARDLPPLPTFTAGWQLGKPDLVVTMPAPFLMPPDGPDLFRNFVLPVPLAARRFVRAVEFRAGDTLAVHHARVLIDASRESRWRDGQDAAPGFAGMDAPGARFPDGHFLGWAPGKTPSTSDLSWPLPAGSDLVVQAHLKPTGRPERVQASIGLYFTDRAPSIAAVMLRMGTRIIDIPAGEANHLVSDSYVLPVDVEALRIYPHAHYLARQMVVSARYPDGRSEGLLAITNWNFNWQDDYEYARPVSLPRGTVLTMRYVYDNSADNPHNPHRPPQRVRFGPQANDEMAELLVQLVPRDTGDLGTLRADVTRKTLLTDVAGEERRVADEPTDIETRNVLGVHYVMLGRGNEAFSQFEQALRLDPDHAVTRYNLGSLALTWGRSDDALAHLTRAVELRPQYAEAHANLGVLLQTRGRLDQAIRHYRQALNVKPDNVAARDNMGRALLERGRVGEAVDEFAALVRLQPEVARAHYHLAVAYAADGKLEAAIESARRALSLAGRDEQLAKEIRTRLQQYSQALQ